MPDPVNCFSQVGDLIAERLQGWPALSGFSAYFERSSEDAVDESEGDTIQVQFVGDSPDVAFGQGQVDHKALYDIEIVTRAADNAISLSRAGLDAIGHVVAAMASDRQFGGRLADIQEVDLGSTEANGVDANGISIRFRAEFTTSRDDWFTLIVSPS